MGGEPEPKRVVGKAFAALPGVFISLERQLTDLPLCALLAAAVISLDRGSDKQSWTSLSCAGLVREMGLVVIVGFVLSAARKRRFKQAAQWALAAIPAVLWIAYVLLLIPQPPASLNPHLVPPLLSIVRSLWHLQQYPLGAAASLFVHALDSVAILGLLLSFGLALLCGIRQTNLLANMALALTCFGITASAITLTDYTEVYNFARPNSPLLLIQLFQAIETGNLSLLAPLALILPRSLLINVNMTLHSVLHFLGR